MQDSQMAADLLGLLRGEFNNVVRLPKSIHKLEALGLAVIDTVPHYRVTVASKKDLGAGRKLKKKTIRKKR